MKASAPHPANFVPTNLVFPHHGTFEVELPDDFSAPIEQAAARIIAAYEEIRSSADAPGTMALAFEERVRAVGREVYKRLPDIDADERFSVLYLFVMVWLSRTIESHPAQQAASRAKKGATTSGGPGVRYDRVSHLAEVQPGRLKARIADLVAWIIVWELENDPLPQTSLAQSPPAAESSKKRIVRPKKRKLSVPDAFHNDQALVPNNPVVAAGIRAIFKGGAKARQLLGGWSQIGQEVLYRQIHRSGRGEIRYYPQIITSGREEPVRSATLWEFVESLNPFTADVALAILAQLCEPSVGNRPKYPLRQSVLITADAIMRYKGILRYGKDRRILEKRIHDEVERLRTLYFDLDRYPMPWEKKGSRYKGDRLFDIVKLETYQLKLFGRDEIIETAWSIRTGQWAEHFFNTEQERVWTSRMAKALIEMDHRNQRKTAQLAKKIGYLMLTVPGGTAHRNHPVTRRVDRILEEIGELPAQAHITKDWAGRLRDNLMKAWDILLTAGLIRKLEFPEGFGFEDTDRAKGWVKDWLASKVVIITPEAIPEPTAKELKRFASRRKDNRKCAKRRVTRRVRKKPQDIQLQICTPAYRKQVRDACQERYLTQRSLAKALGIAPSTLSNILHGRDLPSHKVATKIDTWLHRRGE